VIPSNVQNFFSVDFSVPIVEKAAEISINQRKM
jgi:hypothetical protein